MYMGFFHFVIKKRAFLSITIKQNVKLCKSQPRVTFLSNLLFESYFIADDKNAYKKYLKCHFI